MRLLPENIGKIEFDEVRGLEGIKEATIDLDGTPVKVAVAHGLANANKVMEMIKNGEADYTFIEIMSQRGGCAGGGGQPVGANKSIKARRIDTIYNIDKEMPIRKSHDNPEAQQLYEEF